MVKVQKMLSCDVEDVQYMDDLNLKASNVLRAALIEHRLKKSLGESGEESDIMELHGTIRRKERALERYYDFVAQKGIQNEFNEFVAGGQR